MIKRINLDVNRFVCERLCTERTNKNKIRTFSCERNPNLEYYLKQHAWFEDKNNICAHYLIKDGDKVVLYFSLKNLIASIYR